MTNRHERSRKAVKVRKPLGRLGVPIQTVTVAITNGPRQQFYWFATEQIKEWTLQEIIDTQELHGPFDTEAEADEAARIAILGPDCEVTEGGMWNPAWDKPQ